LIRILTSFASPVAPRSWFYVCDGPRSWFLWSRHKLNCWLCLRMISDFQFYIFS
jgi:hypothetical protein